MCHGVIMFSTQHREADIEMLARIVFPAEAQGLLSSSLVFGGIRFLAVVGLRPRSLAGCQSRSVLSS